MEYAKDEIFNIRYNAKLDRLQIKEKGWTTKAQKFFKRHMLISMISILFIMLSAINFLLIYNFFNILEKI